MIDMKHRMNYINEYKKKHYKRVTIELSKEYYEKHFVPAAKASGKNTSAFIKEILYEKISFLEKSANENADSSNP